MFAKHFIFAQVFAQKVGLKTMTSFQYSVKKCNPGNKGEQGERSKEE